VQDPDTVGTAFKTISMRIRGAKTELEEAGLETDGMVDSTAKLREEILALSGVDIMENDNQFKSTYDILDELAAKWEHLSDIQQATVTELIAGKRQGNIISSLMTNFDTAREALEVSMNSEGSAMEEHAKWSESLEAKLLKLKSTWQSLSQSFMSSGFLKGGVSALTGFVDVIDTLISKLGVIPTLLTGLSAFQSFKGNGFFKVIEDEAAASGKRIGTIFSTSLSSVTKQFNNMGIGTNAEFRNLLDSDINILNNWMDELSKGPPVADAFDNIFKNASNSAKEFAQSGKLASEGVEGFVKQQKTAQVAIVAQNNNLSSAKAIMKEYNSGCKNTAMSQEDFISAVSSGNTGLSKYLSGLNGAKASTSGYIASLVGAKIATIALEAATMALNAALTMGISLAISAAIKAFDEWYVSASELAEKVDEVTTKYQEQHGELTKLKGDYDTTNEDSMISKYGELSKGVDAFGKNISLTADEYAEYQSIVETIAGQIPSLVSGYDSQGNAILSCAGNVQQLTAEYEKLIKAQNDEILIGSSGDINKDFQNAVKDAEHDTAGFFGWNWTKELGLGDSKLSTQSAEIYENILNSADAVKEFNKAINTEGNDLESFLDNSDVDAMSELLESAGFKKEGSFWSGKESNAEHIRRALEEDASKVKNIIDQYYAGLEEEVEGKKSQAQAALSNAFDLSDSQYYGMSDTLKNIAQQTASGFDFEFFADLEEQGISVEKYVNNMLDQLQALSDNQETKLEAAFNLRTQFNDDEISYGEYVSGLEDAASMVDKLNLQPEVKSQIKLSLGLNEEGLVEEYENLASRLSETETATGNVIGFSSKEVAKDFLDGLSSDEASVTWDIVTDPNFVIPEGATDEVKQEILQQAIDLEMMLQGLNFDLNLEVEAAGIEALNTALSESVTATGLSSESISALRSRYAGLENQGFDLSSMFEETSHGIRINRQEFKRFENELASQKIAEVDGELERMKKTYDELGEAMDGASPERKAELFSQRNLLAQRIAEAGELAAQYDGLTSSYNQWLTAESAGNERDMYENVISGFETVKDELSRGWADDSTIEFLELVTGRTDLASKSGKELKEVYDGLDKTIKNTKYSVKDFFTVDDEGNSTSKGVYNFLDAVGQLEEEAFGGLDVVKRDKGGNVIGFDFEIAGGDEAIAEALGISEELVQIMVRAADDAGFVVNMEGTYTQYADMASEAENASNKLKELSQVNDDLGKRLKATGSDFEFDFNSTNVKTVKSELEEANKILDTFKNKDGTINMEADGAVEAMQIVSTLQARLDSLESEKYGIGLTVEDKEFEEPLEQLQNYGHTVAELNQLEINPKANAEEIKVLEGELDNIAEYFANLDKDTKIKLGFEASDDVEDVKKKIESGEVKIPTTLDIQTNMDKNLSDLRDLALLNSGLLSPEQEETIKIRLGIEVESDVKTEGVKEDINNAVDNAVGNNSSTKTEIKTNVNVKAGEVDASDVDDNVEKTLNGRGRSGVAKGANGRRQYSIGTVEPKADNVDTSNLEKETKEKTEEAVGDGETIKAKTNVEINAETTLSELTDILEDVEKIEDKSATIDVEANLDGNIGSAEDIKNLIEFAEGAKALEGVESSDISVDVDFDSNLGEAVGLDQLAKFAEGAKALDGVEDADVSVKVELECEFNNGNFDSLAKFADSATKLQGVESSDVSVEVELDGNLSEWKGNLEDLGKFADNASKLKGVEDANVSVRATLVTEFNESNLDDLAKFVDNAAKLQGVKDSDVSINTNLEGNLGENANIGNLEKFVNAATNLQGVKGKEVKLTTNLFGNLVGNPNLYNLEAFAEGANALQDAKSKEVEIKANLYGNLVGNPNLYSLDAFAEGANALQDAESKDVKLTTNLFGNLIGNGNLYSLESFAEGANELQGVESKDIKINANLYGNLIGNNNLYSLEAFADGANELQDVESKDIKITTNLYGNLVGNPNLYSLETFADSADELQDVESKDISITTNLYGNLVGNPNLYNLEAFADGASELQGVESKNVRIDANLYGNLIGNGNLYSLEAFANGAEDLQNVNSKNVRIDANLYGNLIGNGNLSNLATFAARAKELQGIGDVKVSVTANVDSGAINNAINVLSNVANSGLFKDYNATVTAIVNYNKGTQTPPDDKTAKVNYELGSQDAPKNKTAKVNYALGSQAAPESKTVYVNYVGIGPAAGTAHTEGSAFADGTASSSGRAFARGDWGIKGNGVALGGELGRELVVRDGKFFTIGDKGAEFFRYKKNDIVFNAAQTESLFKYGGIKGANPRGKMLASGTAFASGSAFSSGSGGGFWSNSSSGKNSSTGKSYNSSSSSGDADKFEETIDWIEMAIDRIERSIDQLDTKANSVYRSWSERNKSLTAELSSIGTEIELQERAYDRYMSAAYGTGLSYYWQAKVQNGQIDISTITDEALAKQIEDYRTYYEAALDCKDAILELQETESELYAQQFENIQARYDGIIQGYEHTEKMLNEYISQAEEQGYIISKKYYEALISNEKSNITELRKEQANLIAARDEAVEIGVITKGSEAWMEQCAAIDEVTQAIEESQTALLEFDNAMREIDWGIFDLIQERISGVTEEADFLIELMSNKKLFDDNGKLTSQGFATMGLHAQNYNSYMYQSDEYAAEVEKLDGQIASDPYDQELINRRNELLELQRESILAAEDEKNAITDLISDGIEAELDALQELIDKKNEQLESERDLYEYSKKVKEQTSEIASLEKQLSAYSGDDSEEAKQKIQQIKVDLETARDNLEETEYEKLIGDSEILLNSLYDEYELILNQRLDNVDALLEQVIESINIATSADGNIAAALGTEGAIAIAVSNNATSIKSTLESETNKVGIALSNAMNNIWNTGEGNAKSVLTMYGEDFKSKSTTIITTLNGIKSSVNSMVSSLNKEAAKKVSANKTTTSAKKNPTTTSSSKTTSTTKKPTGDGVPKIGDKVTYVSGQYYYDSEGKKPLGSQKRGEQVYITNINTRDWATHGYHISRGNKLGKGDLGWLKLSQLSGYATGKQDISEDEVAWTQEGRKREFIVRPSDGAILTPVAKGDSILTSTASNNIWNMANSPAEFIKENLKLDTSNVPSAPNVSNVYTQNFENVTFSMPNVHGYSDLLTEMQKDPKFEKLILSMTIDRIAGKSSLAKGKSIR